MGKACHCLEPNGSKSWQFSYRYAGKPKMNSLDVYPTITLADARPRRDDARKLVAEGKNPREVRKEQKQTLQTESENAFEKIAPEKRDPQLKDKIVCELAVILRQLMQRFSDPMTARTLLQSQQNSDEALSIKRDADPTFNLCGYLEMLSQTNGMFIGSSRVIIVNISITRISPIWRLTDTGTCSA